MPCAFSTSEDAPRGVDSRRDVCGHYFSTFLGAQQLTAIARAVHTSVIRPGDRVVT